MLCDVPEERDILKKVVGIFSEKKKPIAILYSFIKKYSDDFRVGKMCGILKISRSSYYAWLGRKASLREKRREKLKIEITRIFEWSKNVIVVPGLL